MPKLTNSRRSESFKEVVRWDLFKMMPTNLLRLQNSRTSPSIISFRSKNLEAVQKWLTEKKVFEEKVENHHGFGSCQAFGMHTRALTLHQTVGASLTILGGVLYGKARQAIEQEAGPIPLVVGDGIPWASHKSWGWCRRRRRSSSYRR